MRTAALALLLLACVPSAAGRGRLLTPEPRRAPGGHHAADNRGDQRCGRRAFQTKTTLNSHRGRDVVPVYEAGSAAEMAWRVQAPGDVRLSLLDAERDLITVLRDWTPVSEGDAAASVVLPDDASVLGDAVLAWELRADDGLFWSCADVRVIPATPARALPHVKQYTAAVDGVYAKVPTAAFAAGEYLRVDMTPSHMLPAHHTCHVRVLSALPPHHRVLYDAAGGSKGFSKILTRDGVLRRLGTDTLPEHLHVRFNCEAAGGAAEETARLTLNVRATTANVSHDLGVAPWAGDDGQLCLRWTQPAGAPWAIRVAANNQDIDADPAYLPVVQRGQAPAAVSGVASLFDPVTTAANDHREVSHCFTEPETTRSGRIAARYHVGYVTNTAAGTMWLAPVHGRVRSSVADGADTDADATEPSVCDHDFCHEVATRGTSELESASRGFSTLAATIIDAGVPVDFQLNGSVVYAVDVNSSHTTFVQWYAVTKKGYKVDMAASMKKGKGGDCEDADKIFAEDMYVQSGIAVGKNIPEYNGAKLFLEVGKYCVAIRKYNGTGVVNPGPVDVKLWARVGGQNDVQAGAKGIEATPAVVASKTQTSWGSDAVGLKLWAAVGGSTDITYSVYAAPVEPGTDPEVLVNAEEVKANQKLVYTQSSLMAAYRKHVYLEFTPQDMPDLGACTAYQVNVIAETPKAAALYTPTFTNPECLRYVPKNDDNAAEMGALIAVLCVLAVLLLAAYVYRAKLPIIGKRFQKEKPKRTFTTPYAEVEGEREGDADKMSNDGGDAAARESSHDRDPLADPLAAGPRKSNASEKSPLEVTGNFELAQVKKSAPLLAPLVPNEEIKIVEPLKSGAAGAVSMDGI